MFRMVMDGEQFLREHGLGKRTISDDLKIAKRYLETYGGGVTEGSVGIEEEGSTYTGWEPTGEDLRRLQQQSLGPEKTS